MNTNYEIRHAVHPDDFKLYQDVGAPWKTCKDRPSFWPLLHPIL